MQDDKKIVLLSENETENTRLTRRELVDEIRRVTNLNIDDASKILEIMYLTKHYFAFEEDEPLPNSNEDKETFEEFKQKINASINEGTKILH